MKETKIDKMHYMICKLKNKNIFKYFDISQ